MFAIYTQESLQLIQITDLHLFANPQDQLLGINTRESFDRVLALVKKNHPKLDALVITGDLSQDDSLESYRYLEQQLNSLACPTFLFPGNHDSLPYLQQIADKREYLEKIVRTPYWQLIFLNSQVEGAVFGTLDDAELALLEQALHERPDLHTLISFHHHILPMNSRWLDTINLRNHEYFKEMIERHPQVRAVLCGHVHQESDEVVNKVRYLSTPSTCLQFKRFNDDFAVDTLQPGYRWLQLHSDGRIDSAVERLTGNDFQPDVHSHGY